MPHYSQEILYLPGKAEPAGEAPDSGNNKFAHAH